MKMVLMMVLVLVFVFVDGMVRYGGWELVEAEEVKLEVRWRVRLELKLEDMYVARTGEVEGTLQIFVTRLTSCAAVEHPVVKKRRSKLCWSFVVAHSLEVSCTCGANEVPLSVRAGGPTREKKSQAQRQQRQRRQVR